MGNFHRAHQAVYVDDLLANENNKAWGITSLNMVPGGGDVLSAVRKRGMRYVLKTISPQSVATYREIASILDCIDLTVDVKKAVEAIANEKIQLVTMTVTGLGYYLRGDKDLDVSAKAVASDIQGKSLSTIYGYIKEGIKARKLQGGGKLTILSCDNMRNNGHLLRKGMEQFLEATGNKDIAMWMADMVSFPCSMVDRITPVAPSGLSEEVSDLFGISNDESLMSESFIQWVIEDDFAGKRPPLDEVGVLFTDDVISHEEAKIRILNGGHVALGYLAALRGHKYVWQGMQDEKLVEFFDAYATKEVLPGICQGGKIDLHDYYLTTKERFANPNLDDTVARICRRGTAKVPEFLGKTIKVTFERGEVPNHALTVIAAWFEVMRRCASGNGPFTYDDSGIDIVSNQLVPGGEEAFARNEKLWGSIPVDHTLFVEKLVSKIKAMATANGEIPK